MKNVINYSSSQSFVSAWWDADICYNHIVSVKEYKTRAVVEVRQPRRERTLTLVVRGKLNREAWTVINDLVA